MLNKLHPNVRQDIVRSLSTRGDVDYEAVILDLFDKEAAAVCLAQSFADWSGFIEAWAQAGIQLDGTDPDKFNLPKVEILDVTYWDAESGGPEGIRGGVEVEAKLVFWVHGGNEIPLRDRVNIISHGDTYITIQMSAAFQLDEYWMLFGLDG